MCKLSHKIQKVSKIQNNDNVLRTMPHTELDNRYKHMKKKIWYDEAMPPR